jgi:hypothetical protein
MARLPSLADLRLLAGLPDSVRAIVERSFEQVRFAFGESVVTRGDPV